MTSVPPTQPPAAPETDVRLTEAERKALLSVEHDLAAIAAVERIVAERVRVVEGERDAWETTARQAYDQHETEFARAESAEAAHRALQAAVEALADEWASKPDDRRYDGDRARALRALLAGAR